MQLYAFCNLLAGFDIRILHIDRPDAKLLIAKEPMKVRRHVMLDQERIAVDRGDDIRLVSAGIEIAMANLTIIIGTDGVVALADMNQDMNIVRQVLRLPY